jgi:hypothetical protein
VEHGAGFFHFLRKQLATVAFEVAITQMDRIFLCQRQGLTIAGVAPPSVRDGPITSGSKPGESRGGSSFREWVPYEFQ